MLKIAALRDRSGDYYLRGQGQDLPRGVDPAAWAGSAAGLLGFRGPVDGPGLRSLLGGCRPRALTPLGVRAPEVSAYDLTFAAPKSVSVLAALATPELARAVVDAHRRAVEGALLYLEQRALAVRREAGGDRHLLATHGALAAAFVHATSRSLDPHLHSHVVVANLIHGADGRWGRLDGPSLFAHRRAAGELYRAGLRGALRQDCGLDWERRRNATWELSGFDPLLLGAFSARSAEVRLAAFQAGRPGTRTEWARRSTRDEKRPVTRSQLEERWQAVAARTGLGLPPEALERRRASARAPGTGFVDEHRFAAAVYQASDREVRRRTAVAAWADGLATGGSSGLVERCVEQLASWGEGHGTREAPRAPAEVVPSGPLLRLLGPRPADPGSLALWQGTAREVLSYRRRWGVGDRDHPLGAGEGGLGLGSMSTGRLAEHLELSRRLDELARRLGRSASRALDEAELVRRR